MMRMDGAATRMMTIDRPDIFLVNLPWWDADIPYCAPAVLKGIAHSHGYYIKTHDFSLDLLHKFCHGDVDQYSRLQSYFLTADKRTYDTVEKFYKHIVRTIQSTECQYVGISVFSVWTHRAVLDVLTRLRIDCPNHKILVGGRGLSVKPHLSILDSLTTAERMLNFEQTLVKRKLVDTVILGDGEDAIVDLLNGNNIDQTVRHGSDKNLDYPFSNFDNVDFSQYLGVAGRIQLPVISSKGCVRSCDFCDVAAHMKHFQSKQGRRLAEEMIYLAERYNIYNFTMADSIVNGNMKSLRECCEYLAEYNATAKQRIKWSANWICRFENTTKADFFDLMAASGCESLTIGVESASNHVLMVMNKKSSVEGVYYELFHIDRVGIQAVFNNLIGHWSEHYEHFVEHIDFLLQIGPYLANRTISDLMLGEGFNILIDTPAAEKSNIVVGQDNFSDMFYSSDNPDLTVKIKLLRVLAMYTLCYLLNYPVNRAYIRLEILYKKILLNKDLWNAWTAQHIDRSKYKVCKSVDFIDQVESYVDTTLQKKFPVSKIKLNLESYACNGWPNLLVLHNGTKVHEQCLDATESQCEFEITHDFSSINKLEIFVNNKSNMDTVVDAQGKIIQDKKVIFKNINIDGIDIFCNPDFFYQHTKMQLDNGTLIDPPDGLYMSGSRWQLEYNPPFWRHYLAKQPYHSEYQVNNNKESGRIMLDKIRTEILTMEY